MMKFWRQRRREWLPAARGLWIPAAWLLTGMPVTAAPTETPAVQIQWLFNFDRAPWEAAPETYVPDPASGEVAPMGDGIRIVNHSGQLALKQTDDGRRTLYLDGSGERGDGLLFEHRLSGHSSRIFEIVVAPTPEQPLDTRLISLNDWEYRPPGQIQFLGISGGSTDLGTIDAPIVKLAPTTGIFTNFPSVRFSYLRGPAPVPSDGQFTHLGMVYEHEHKALYIYVNGALAKSMDLPDAGESEIPIFRAIGLSNRALYEEFDHGFTGHIDAVAESTFDGRFSPGMFQLIEVEDAVAPPIPQIRRLTLNAPLQTTPYPEMEGPAPAMAAQLERAIPKIPSISRIVYQPESWSDSVYHHNPIITWWKGRLYVTWHAGGRGEYTALAGAPVYVSEDGGLTWTRQSLVPEMTPRTMHPTEDRLYILGDGRHYYTEDGKTWHTLDRAPPDYSFSSSNKHYVRLRDGRLMQAELGRAQDPALSAKGLWAVSWLTHDPTGLTGWSGGYVDASACPDPGEPAGYEGPDGVLHYIARCGPRIFHAYSEDGGQTWTQLVQQPQFTDSPSNKEFGTLPDGSVWCIANPIPGNRQHLVLGISRDGWNFNETYLVRWEPHTPRFPAPHKLERPGYEYPGAWYHDGKLYAAYSIWREGIGVSIIDLAGEGLIKTDQ